MTTESSKSGAITSFRENFHWIRTTCDDIHLNFYCRVLFSSRVRVRVRITFSVWVVSGYAHVFVLLTVVTVILPS